MIGKNFTGKISVAALTVFFIIAGGSCGSSGGSAISYPGIHVAPGETIADASVAHEAVLRSIPDSVLTTIRSTFEVAYFHTSHGTHVSYGVFGLPGFKAGDSVRYGVSTSGTVGMLHFRDYHSGGAGLSYEDLSQADDGSWTTWVNEARAWLANPANAGVTVFMWSWCNIQGHDAAAYCNSMQTLISEFGAGGSNVGPGRARANPVNFVFMTGHANDNANVGNGRPKNQADIITEFCRAHGYFCIDYYSIDTTTIDGVYYEDTNDNGESDAYGGNFYADWQGTHALGVDWYENRTAPAPAGGVAPGQHNDQHITANRKAYAFWWVMARLTGWDVD